MSDPTTPTGVVEMFDFMCDHDVELQPFQEFVELRERMARNEERARVADALDGCVTWEDVIRLVADLWDEKP